MDNNQNPYSAKIKKCKMIFPEIEWDSIVGYLSTVLENNHFKKSDAFSLAKKEVLCKSDQLILNGSNHTHEGIDLPVLLSKKDPNDDTPTIMIIGESPIRDTRQLKEGGLYIGTPFAVAAQKDVPKQCNIYKYIFCHLLNEGYNVYITDAVKVWYNGLQKKDFIKEFKKYQEILKKEIDDTDPKLIVTWGKTAEKACEIIAKENPQKLLPTFHQTHPVKLNWDRWKVKMLLDAIRNGNDIGKYYIKDSSTEKDSIYLSYYIAKEIWEEAYCRSNPLSK